MMTYAADLDELVKRGIIEQIGITGKGTEYVLRGHKGVKGIDEVRHPELILEYVKKYGPISNRQVRELLGVDIYKASKLLNKLVKNGSLVKLGASNKTAAYGLKGS